MSAADWTNATALAIDGARMVAEFDIYHHDGLDLDIEMALANASQATQLATMTAGFSKIVHAAAPR